MKKNRAVLFFSALILAAVLTACSSVQTVTAGNSSNNSVIVSIDLVNVNNDKVMVTIKPSTINSETITYQLPAIIPGTYAISDYGRFVEDFSAIDNEGNALTVTKRDVNTWVIDNAVQLAQVKYYVNDTYDCEVGDAFLSGNKTIFSPAGTNILAGKQFMINMAGFVGYFENQKNYPYKVNINHPSDLIGTTAMNDLDVNNTNDVFNVSRYADLVDSPVMYASPDTASFTVDDMKVVLHVYSPINKEITANYLLPDLKKMITAQKKFLGNINHTPKYAILVYVTAAGKDDASGIGALEHNTSTTAVFMQTMKSQDLINVISHEFFHTLTPLNVHSREIHDFDFNNPKMSAHLWMYEGITEYFANLFQVNQGLISEDEFFNTMSLKEFNTHKLFPANISFTEMSKNILNPEVKKLYPNVYQKGALLAMCIDIIIRDKSNGERGVLDMMGRLSKKYGPDKPFEDSELISEVTNITYPEVGDFIQKYIVNGEPVDYSQTLKLVGVDKINIKRPVEIAFIVDNKPYIKIDTTDHKVLVSALDGQNEFINSIGLQDNDQMLEINGQLLDTSDLISVLGGVYNLKEGTPMVIKVIRNGQEMELRGNAKLNLVDSPSYKFVDQSKKDLKDKWLKK